MYLKFPSLDLRLDISVLRKGQGNVLKEKMLSRWDRQCWVTCVLVCPCSGVSPLTPNKIGQWENSPKTSADSPKASEDSPKLPSAPVDGLNSFACLLKVNLGVPPRQLQNGAPTRAQGHHEPYPRKLVTKLTGKPSAAKETRLQATNAENVHSSH